MSLRTRLIVLMVSLFGLFIWAMTFLAATVLHHQLEMLLSEQQFAATQRVASTLDTRLKDNVRGLTLAAAGLPADLSYASIQPLLAQRPYLHIAFSGGIAVIGLDGIAIADYPVSPARRGAYFGDREYFRKVVETGQPYIDKPIIERALKRPVLTTAVPIFAADGRLRAVMTGITDLTAPNFLGFVADRAQIGNGEYFVISLRDRIFVAATDGKRVMQASPERGLNRLYDRMADGFEGSGVAVSSEGVSKLYSGVHLSSADWLILAALPTEFAFGPVTTLRNYFYVIAGLLTLAVALLIRLILGRLLTPLKAASHAVQRMTGGELPLALLPVQRNDEVGQLVTNFNRLIADRQRYEAALADSEQRFRLLVEQAPEGIFVQTRGRFAYANRVALALFGAASKEQLLNEAIIDRIDPGYRDRGAERIRQVNEMQLSNPAMEQVYLRLDGTQVAVEVSAVPFRFDGEDGSLVFVRDITVRKRADEAVRISEARFRSLFDHMLEGFAYCRMLFEHGEAVDFVYLDVNPAFARLTGLSDVAGKKVSELIPGFREDNPGLLAAYGRVAAGGLPEKFEIYVPGLAHWFSVSTYHTEGNCFVAVFDVITQKKNAEAIQSRLNRTLRLLSDCNAALVHAECEQSLLEQICRLVVEQGGYQMAWVGYAEDDPAKSVRPVAQAGSSAGYLDSLVISWDDDALGCGPTGRAIRFGQTQINHDFTTATLTPWRDAAAAHGYRSSIALPLLGKQQVLGALSIYSSADDAFIDDEVVLLKELVSNLMFGIESLRTHMAHTQAEKKLSLTRERLQGLFSSIADAVFVHRLQEDGMPGCFIEVNDVACQRLGYSRTELLAMSPQEIDVPDHQVDIGAIVEKLIRQKSVVFEQTHLTKDGRRIPVEINSSTVTLHGQMMIISLVRDITERKEAEQLRSESARELHRLSIHLEAVREEERTRLSRELHDELGQLLTALKMDITLLRSDLPATGDALTKLERMTALADEMLDAVRRIASDLRPAMLDDLGLKAAVEWLTEELEKRYSGITCHLVFALNGWQIEGELATAAYRIIQECLTNIVRHAEASKIHIVVAIPDQRHLIISVQDNGHGLQEMKTKNKGFGLLGMQERVNALGGSLTVDSIPGEGVLVDVTIPLPSMNSGT